MGLHAALGTNSPCAARTAAAKLLRLSDARHVCPAVLPGRLPLVPCRPQRRSGVVTHALKEEVLDRGHPGAPQTAKAVSEDVLTQWRKAHAVCFDVDCTVCVNDALDLLADYLQVGPQVAQLTKQAMDGSMSLEGALEERLRIINCKPEDIVSFLTANPAAGRLAPGIRELVAALQARGVAVYLISGGFRELTLPVARELGIPTENVFANRMNWQADDETGAICRLAGFDVRELTAHHGGKPAAIGQLRDRFPYETIVMVGDGVTDLEAAEITRGADAFIGYGGVVVREKVAAGADWFVMHFDELTNALKTHRVAMIGSGAWACAAARNVARNAASGDPGQRFEREVRMWVHEEQVDGRPLTEIINETHENVKYLPGVQLGDNLRACPNLEEAVAGADVLVFCAPHQFVYDICKQLRGKVAPDAIAISLTKGMRVRHDGPQLVSEMVRRMLGIDCSVLMGPNIAQEIAAEQLSEATIAYNVPAHGELLEALFATPSFYVSLVPDVAGAEMCGTLKNVVALAAGFVDGLGLGPNTKASIVRAGLNEMRRLSKALYPGVRDETFYEACGVADLVATCWGGRNRRVAEAFVRAAQEGQPKTFEQLEVELLRGQKLQGALTAQEVAAVLRARGWGPDYPLFTTVAHIVEGRLPPAAVLEYRTAALQPLDPAPNNSANGAGLPTASRGSTEEA